MNVQQCDAACNNVMPSHTCTQNNKGQMTFSCAIHVIMQDSEQLPYCILPELIMLCSDCIELMKTTEIHHENLMWEILSNPNCTDIQFCTFKY